MRDSLCAGVLTYSMAILTLQKTYACLLRPISRGSSFRPRRNCRTTMTASGLSKTDVVKGRPNDMKGKNIVVTGGNSGIGLAMSKALAARGANVVIATRNSEKGAKAVQEIQSSIQDSSSDGSASNMHIDLASFRSIKEFVQNFNQQNKKLDVLVNNASVFVSNDATTEDGLEVTMQTNYLGPMALMELLLPKLKESAPSRVVWTTSGLESIGRLPDLDKPESLEGSGMKNDIFTYGTSKLLGLMANKHKVTLLEGSGVTDLTAWPGIANTGIPDKQDYTKIQSWLMLVGFKAYGQSPENGAKSLLYACCAPEEDLREQGLAGDVMYGPIHKRLPYIPFAGFPAGTLNAFGFSTELNVTNDTPKNPVVQDDAACKEVYDKTIALLKSKGAL